MNTVVTSKAEILKASRELIQQKGWSAVNIRAVAAACGVSLGHFIIILIPKQNWWGPQ